MNTTPAQVLLAAAGRNAAAAAMARREASSVPLTVPAQMLPTWSPSEVRRSSVEGADRTSTLSEAATDHQQLASVREAHDGISGRMLSDSSQGELSTDELEAIKESIRVAEKRLHFAQMEQYSPQNLVRAVPVIGNLWSWVSPVKGRKMEGGLSFSV